LATPRIEPNECFSVRQTGIVSPSRPGYFAVTLAAAVKHGRRPPAQPARSVLDGGEHDTSLRQVGINHHTGSVCRAGVDFPSAASRAADSCRRGGAGAPTHAQSRPKPWGSSTASCSSRSRSMIVCNASSVALSRIGSGTRSSQAAYSACNATSSATAANQRCGRLRVGAGQSSSVAPCRC